MLKKDSDIGFGVEYNRRVGRLLERDGTVNVEVKGLKLNLRDLYLYLIKLKWTTFILILLGGFILFNVLFALLYLAIGVDHLSGASTDEFNDFWRTFFFSVQTVSTVGYGAISPESYWSSLVASIESFFGLIGVALITGLIYGRFSSPNLRLKLSDKVLVGAYKDHNALMFKITNSRKTVLMDMDVTVNMTYEVEVDGRVERQYFNLKLERHRLEFLPLTWTIVHPIDNNSPLKHFDLNELNNITGEVLVLFRAFDEGFGQYIMARSSYTFKEIELNRKFDKTYSPNKDGVLENDLTIFNRTVEAPIQDYNYETTI